MSELGVPFDFRNGLPQGLTMAEPLDHGQYDPAVLIEAERRFPLIATRKLAGEQVFVVALSRSDREFADDIHLCHGYDRARVDNRFLRIIDDLYRLRIPPNTLLVGQVTTDKGGRSQLILQSVLCWYGDWMGQTHYDEILALLKGLDFRQVSCVRPLRMEMGPLAFVQERATREGWEVVIYRHEYCATWTLAGPPALRPDGAYIWKPSI